MTSAVRLTTVADHPCLLIEPPTPALAISSAPFGGGIGPCHWVVNLHVSKHYARDDPARHLDEVRRALDLSPTGVGLMTAAKVERFGSATDHGVHVVSTVGLSFPTWAADIGPRGSVPIPRRDDAEDPVTVIDAPQPPLALSTRPAAVEPGVIQPGAAKPGTINLVAWVPQPLSPAALVNMVATATEAKVQALGDAGVPGTGTATDAVVVMCPTGGEPEPYGGPRSRWGAPLARAIYRAVLDGATKW